MKRILHSALASLLVCISATAQIVSTNTTYTAGSIPTQIHFGGAPDTSITSPCIDTLTVTIPAGDQVVYIDVEYDMTAAGAFGFKVQASEERLHTLEIN
jgi:hypothetical protein